ncbi:hypothetical protein ACVWZ8_004925 [Arthrobacter sp. UYCu723]
MSKKRRRPAPKRAGHSPATHHPARPGTRRHVTAKQATSEHSPNTETDNGPRLFDPLEPQGLAATYWLDTAAWEGPQELSVRFSGTRSGEVAGEPAEYFEVYEDVDSVTPGTGRIAVTSRVSGITGGLWDVTATPVARTGRDPQRPAIALPGRPSQRTTVHTRFHALAQGPGVHAWSWPVLVGLGAVLAVLLQALFLTRQGIDPYGPVWLTILANAVGGVCARLWCLALNRQRLSSFFKTGACIQGFLAGALSTIVAGSLIFGLPTGRILDATAVGLFFGLALGRPGCFFRRVLLRAPHRLAMGAMVLGPAGRTAQAPCPALRSVSVTTDRPRNAGHRAGSATGHSWAGLRGLHHGLHPGPAAALPVKGRVPHPAGTDTDHRGVHPDSGRRPHAGCPVLILATAKNIAKAGKVGRIFEETAGERAA